MPSSCCYTLRKASIRLTLVLARHGPRIEELSRTSMEQRVVRIAGKGGKTWRGTDHSRCGGAISSKQRIIAGAPHDVAKMIVERSNSSDIEAAPLKLALSLLQLRARSL